MHRISQASDSVPCPMTQLATILQKEIDSCTLNGDNIEKLLYQRRLTIACRHSSLRPSYQATPILSATCTQPLPSPALVAAARVIYQQATSRAATEASLEAMIMAVQLMLDQTAAQFNISITRPGSSSSVPAGPTLTTESESTAATSSSTSKGATDPESASNKFEVTSGQHHHLTMSCHSGRILVRRPVV